MGWWLECEKCKRAFAISGKIEKPKAPVCPFCWEKENKKEANNV